MKKTMRFFIAVFVAFCIGIVFGDSSAYATDINTITEHVKVRDAQLCITKGRLKPTIELNDLKDFNDFLQNDSADLALPNGVSSSDLVSCGDLLKDVLPSFNSNNEQSKREFLEALGYTPIKNSSVKRKCSTFSYHAEVINPGATLPIIANLTLCGYVDSDNKITEKGISIDIPVKKDDEGNYTGNSKGTAPLYAYWDGDIIKVFVNGLEYPVPARAGDDWGEVVDEVNSKAETYSNDQNVDYMIVYDGKTDKDENADGASTSTEYKLSDFSTVFSKIKVLLGTNKGTTYTKDESELLLQYYVSKYGETSCTPMNDAEEVTINGTRYYIRKKAGTISTFYVINNNNWWSEAAWSYVIDGLKNSTIADGVGLPECKNCEKDENGNCIDTPDVERHNPGDEDDESGIGADDEDMCFNGANSLGWIVCPIISALHSTLDWIYDEIITPFLEINVSAFNTDSNGVYKGWQTFQGFANIAFVILLLVVVFSQITGIGIDNLGIKRILPKLIVAAVLINLSYIICQLLVDVSNITGYGLKNLFEGIQINGESAGAGQGILTTAISAAIAGGAIAGAAATASAWAPFIILPLLAGLVSMLIAVLFMFILLGVRQAGVIILVVVSPLAFVLYMLPNTKPLFQKWWKALTGLLLLFPICGALIGGSALAGKIIASTGTGFGINMIAALLTVIPFFFVPTLLKGSFSALGNIGAKISGFGQGMGKRLGGLAQSGVKRTDAFKNIQANARDREDMRSRRAEKRRLEGVTRRIGNISANMRTPEQQLQYAKAQAALEKMNDEDLFNDPELIKSEAASRRFNRQVEATKAKNVNSGMVNRIGEVKNFDGNGNSFSEDTLAYALYNATDDVERYALTSQLMASGHHGAEALHQVMQALGNDGNTVALQRIATAAKGDNKLGDLKSGARSTYDYINDLAEGKISGGAEGNGNNISDYTARVNWGGLSEQQLIGMDKEELKRYSKHINDIGYDNIMNDATGKYDREKALISQANAAWNNVRLRGSAKKDVQDVISEIAFGRGNTAQNTSANATEGESFDIDQDDNNATGNTGNTGSTGGSSSANGPSSTGGTNTNSIPNTFIRDEGVARVEAEKEDARRNPEIINTAHEQALKEEFARQGYDRIAEERGGIGTFSRAQRMNNERNTTNTNNNAGNANNPHHNN